MCRRFSRSLMQAPMLARVLNCCNGWKINITQCSARRRPTLSLSSFLFARKSFARSVGRRRCTSSTWEHKREKISLKTAKAVFFFFGWCQNGWFAQGEKALWLWRYCRMYLLLPLLLLSYMEALKHFFRRSMRTKIFVFDVAAAAAYPQRSFWSSPSSARSTSRLRQSVDV